ncbi:MAG TPA: hypothetical protein VFR41_07430, partial [Acidimicrobiia bacterium]|nr:hypothetical protein [Acidimicrobiia bacterium]
MRVTASFGSGFLLAVLWFDLMFDVQIGHRSRQPRDEALDSIAGYYRRVTTTSRPMSALVAAVMVVTLAALTGEVAAGDSPRWAAMSSLGLVALAVA